MILDDIIADKKQELEASKRKISLEDLRQIISKADSKRDFKGALEQSGISLIAEVKRASPSAGIICKDFDPVRIGKIYEESGASAISVLTEQNYFKGSLESLGRIRESVALPLLRKDFVFDEYQIYESKAFGADAVLLIAAVLSDEQMAGLLDLCFGIGLDPLVEVHTAEELSRVLETKAQIIGINNRDLKTFEIDLTTTLELARSIPEDKIIVSESGIRTFDDIELMRKAGVDAVLVGEALMRGGDVKRKVRELLGKNNDERLATRSDERPTTKVERKGKSC